MPQIIVQAAPGDRPGALALQEPSQRQRLNSDHFASQLVERIGWALMDAEDLEETADTWGDPKVPDLRSRGVRAGR